MKITIKNGKSEKIHIYIDDEYQMTVDSTFWFSEKWHNLKEINNEELVELENSVNSRRAFLSGMNMLSRRAHGKNELIRKLSVKHTTYAARCAVEHMEELGLIDDFKFAQLLAQELYERKHFTAKRIRMELISKGIDRQIADETVKTLDKDDIIRIILLLQTKYKNYLSDEKGIKRAINGLMRMGYNYYDIKKAFAQLSLETEGDYYNE